MILSKNQILLYMRKTLSLTLVLCLICIGAIGAVWAVNVYESRILTAESDPSYIKGYTNVLMVGVDKDGVRTDVIMFAQYDRIDKKISILQIPRDTYDETNKIDKKINSSYQTFKNGKLTTDIYGVYKSVENITGHKIDNYVLVNTKGFRDIIDSMGGVDFKVPQRMEYEDPYQDLYIDLYPGMQHLDGDKAEQLVRFRGYPTADLQRTKVQRDFLMAALDKLLSPEGLLKLTAVKDAAMENFETDLSEADILSYIGLLMDNEITSEDITFFSLEGDVVDMGGSYFMPDKDKNRINFEKYFVDESTLDKVSDAEIKLRNKLLADSGTKKVSVDYSVKTVSPWERMTSKVRIVDASGGKADVEYVKSTLTSLGYGNKPVVYTSGLVYNTSRMIAKEDLKVAHNIAQGLGYEELVIGSGKTGDFDIVIVLGNDNG